LQTPRQLFKIENICTNNLPLRVEPLVVCMFSEMEFLLHPIFICSTWTYSALIVTCSWNGLEQYWSGICVSHSWDLGNWGSMPATVFQFYSTKGPLLSMMFPKKSHSNFSLCSQSVHTKSQHCCHEFLFLVE